MAQGPAQLCCTRHPLLCNRRRHSYRRRRVQRWRRLGEWCGRLSSTSSSSEDEATSDYYHSDTETNMPGGFENSAMKSSFSLSSLQPSSASLETPEHARPERPYNSLRKTCRRDPESEVWRRSLDRREDSKDEFWDTLKPSYLYLMDSHLMDSCKEVGRDLHYGTSPTHDWTFEQFCTQFTELDLWLTSIQETIYSREENVTDRNLRLTHIEEMHRKTNKRKIFNNQGGRLLARFPDTKDDVRWRLAHLNRKWERLEQTVSPLKRTHPEHLTHAIDLEHELNCLRKWLRLTERRLLPLNFHTTWTTTELEAKAKEHQVIQREVELHGKIVRSILKRCDRLEGEDTTRGQAIRAARDLERRWQYLYIRSLEWLCHVENQTKEYKNKSAESAGVVDSDDCEPVLKHPRLSSPWPVTRHGGEDMMDISTTSVSADMVGTFTPTPTINDAARKLFADEASLLYTKSARHGPNLEVTYFKHQDTDSEKDDLESESKNVDNWMETDSKQLDESSDEEDEWTYKVGEGEDSLVQNDRGSWCQSTETLASATKCEQPRKPSIEKLIQQVDEIVPVSPARRPRDFPICVTVGAKSKVNEWFKTASWDGEGPKTQGESCDASGEFSNEDEGHSSGDFNTNSVIQCHQSAEALASQDSPATPLSCKVPGVVLRTKNKGISTKRPLSESGLPPPQLPSHLPQSRSESALNQMDSTPTNSVKMDTSVLSSSTTAVEEAVNQTQEGSGSGCNTNSLRKRKIKLKKRNLGKKSESGGSHSPSSPVRRIPASGTETEEEAEGEARLRSARRKQPVFRLGPEGGSVSVYTSTVDKALSADSSFSEQAWDSFQEKYMSEAYSEETPDQETTRRLLEFGEDYRNHFDSQSDGASSLSISRPPSFHRRRRPLVVDRDNLGLDSDAEWQVIRKIVSKSSHQLGISEQVWTRLSEATPHLVMANDFEEIKYMCKEHIHVLTNVEKENSFGDEFREIRSLIDKWTMLEDKSEELQKLRSLQREMDTLQEELMDLSKRATTPDPQDRQQLDKKIRQLKLEQGSLRERRSQLLEIKAAVNKFFTNSGSLETATTRLQDEINNLYYLWEETNRRVAQQIDSLSELSATWQTFESHLAELQVALRGDHNTLRMLGSALQQEPISKDVASSVIDVAKILSEKQDLTYQSVSPTLVSLPISLEGSLSDSGISDSGSEQESERERRLSVLRRLARQLEAALSPDSLAVLDMARRIEQAESELRGLQKTCRELIVKTSKVAVAKAPEPPSILINRSKKNSSDGPLSFMEVDRGDDPDPDKGWLWRVVRAALPFQMAILAIFCVACLLEPSCCDSMNNLHFSLTPQLRYMNGRPPV